ncbi:gap junction alpha-3 protein-like [Styela clava]|uniref:gap junction alpha-3 protein-like n=1 Tax=Styela clava TaxID=7725 RepID=UPI00193A7B78|nr:gap junction alpha-3 protein-like [Styela clava]
MGWHLMEKLIEQSGEHSTLIGKFWVTSVFILRLLIATAIADDVWKDGQDDFVCNTLSPGCLNVCYNEFSPVVVSRYWMLQILFTTLPSMIFIVYTAHKLDHLQKVIKARKAKASALKKLKKKRIAEGIEARENNLNIEDDDDDDDDKDEEIVATKLSVNAPSKLFLAYFFVVLSRTIVEIGFTIGQYYLYTFKFMVPELWQCQHWPCPNVVDCFVGRPKEKSVLICVFFGTGCIMVMLNLLELYHISGNFSKAWKERDDDITKHADQGPSFGGIDDYDYNEWAPGADYMEDEIEGYPNASGLPNIRPLPYGRRFRRGRRYR